MKADAFSKFHPAINFLFFLGAIGCGVLFQHPAYLLVSVIIGCSYYLTLHGKKGWKLILGLLPLFAALTALNPLLNTYGEHILFTVFGRPYTLEALLYGGAIAAIFVNTSLWFGCYNRVLTEDKFTALFGNLIPALSLLLVMVLRLVPTFIRKTKTISGARAAIGKGISESAAKKEKLQNGLTVLGALTDWALEGSVVTGDSMRARGYGCAKRSSFLRHRWKSGDLLLLCLQGILFVLTVVAAVLGQTKAQFTPRLAVAPLSWGVAAYGCFLFIPLALQIKENILWHISRSKI